MRRREFVTTASTLAFGGLAAACAPQTGAGPSTAVPTTRTTAARMRRAAKIGPVADRMLVLVELQGGNDGLNTVIPHTDPLYARLRPGLAIAGNEIISLDGGLGFHPALAPLAAVYEAGELKIVNSVGYPKPNRSHFRSIEIWEQATPSDQYASEGWITRALDEHPDLSKRAADADAIVVGIGNIGPLAGPGTRLVNMREPRQFLAQSEAMAAISGRADTTPALRHIVRTQNEAASAADAVRRKFTGRERFPRQFAGDPFSRSLSIVANLIADGVDIPVWKVTLGSFDTHADQRPRHARLLTNLGSGLSAFRAAMIQLGRWDDTLVVTYSEFGRRVAENLSRGTDHGTAAPLFMLGGGVDGGIAGAAPDLVDLDAGDLKARVDFRQVYAGIIAGWWGQPDNFLARQGFSALPVLRRSTAETGAAQQKAL